MAQNGGKKYYVSVNGCDLQGVCENSPMSYATAMSKVYTDNDEVLLKCGESFVGVVNFKTEVENHDADHRVKISCYGEGALPKISAAIYVEDPGVFKLVEENHYVVDFRTEENPSEWQNNIGYFRDEAGNKYCSYKDNLSELKENFDYLFDGELLHIYCDENPTVKLGRLMFAYRECLFLMNSDTEVCNLNICDTGGIGMIKAEATCDNIYIHDCIIDDCGGSILCFNPDRGPTRYGNGIEFYDGGTSNVLIENNLFRNAYDVGFTMQGHIATYDGVVVRNNVFVKNNQSSEIWTMSDKVNGVKNYEYYGNLSFGTGRGWGHYSRPTGKANTEILFYHYHSPILEMQCHHNIMFDPYRLYWWPIKETEHKFINGVISYENTIYARDDIYSINWDKHSDVLGALESEYNKEKGSVLNVIDDISAYDEMMRIAETSLDIEEIREAARKFGIISAKENVR